MSGFGSVRLVPNASGQGLFTSRVASLDGIRGIALLLVLLCHTTPQVFRGGNFGVDLFFVLSGFLITSILLREARQRGTIDIGRFYLRRALRLLPALFVMVGAVLVYTAIMQPEKLSIALGDAKHIIFYVFNWRLAFDYDHIAQSHQIMFTHLWSLSVEEQFYMVWPCLVLVLVYFKIPRSIISALLLVGLVVPAVTRFLAWESGSSYWIYFRTDYRFDILLWGAAVAWALDWGLLPQTPAGRLVLSRLGGAGLICVLVLSSFNLITNGYGYRGAFSLIGLASALLIAAAVWCPPRPLEWLLNLPPLRWVGKISYGLYLWHVPVVLVCDNIADLWLRNALGLAMTFVLASISYYGFELWFLRLKEHIGHPPAYRPALAPSVEAHNAGEALLPRAS